MRFRHVVALLVTLAACSLDTNDPNVEDTGRLLVVNGARNAGDVRIFIDGTYEGALPLGLVAQTIELTGPHTLEVRRGNNDPGFVHSFTAVAGQTVAVVAFDSLGNLRPSVLTDTGAVVPAGATKLRVAHYAAAAGPIDIWRTQPDFATPTRTMFPFSYLDQTPYLQSTPGDWRILVSDTVPQATPDAPMPDTIGMSSLINIPAGVSRTVVVVDALPSGVQFVVLAP